VSADSAPSISRDKEKGWITEGRERIVTFRIKTFQAFADRLIKMAGSTLGGVLLYQMGNEIGRTALHYSRNLIRSESDVGKALDIVYSQRGWGRCLGVETETVDGETKYVFKMTGTPLSHERASKEPTCHIVRGILAGWIEAYVDAKAKRSREVECASMGHQSCVFEVVLSK